MEQCSPSDPPEGLPSGSAGFDSPPGPPCNLCMIAERVASPAWAAAMAGRRGSSGHTSTAAPSR